MRNKNAIKMTVIKLVIFLCNISAICGFNAVVTATSTAVYSPGWPDKYPSDMSCVWNFSTRLPGSQIVVEFILFRTEHGKDFLEVT